jgi:hypothetical protein
MKEDKTIEKRQEVKDEGRNMLVEQLVIINRFQQAQTRVMDLEIRKEK